MTFNARAISKLYFPKSKANIASNQYDFEYIALHELVHGLGMVSFWGTFAPESRAGSERLSLIVPPVISGTSLQAIGIYDYLLAGRGLWRDRRADIEAWLATGSPQGLESARQTYQEATTPASTFFVFPRGLSLTAALSTDIVGTLQLHTENGRFIAGTSIVHVDQQKFTSNEDFLMRPSPPLGQDLKSLMQRFKGRPFGRGLLRVFATMGYSLTPESTVSMLESGAATHHVTGVLVVTMLLLLLQQ